MEMKSKYLWLHEISPSLGKHSEISLVLGRLRLGLGENRKHRGDNDPSTVDAFFKQHRYPN